MPSSPEIPQVLKDQWDTTRILSDADLIRGGATLEAGRLVVAAHQTEPLAEEVSDNVYPLESHETLTTREKKVNEYSDNASFLLYAHTPRETFGFAYAWDNKAEGLLGGERDPRNTREAEFIKSYSFALKNEQQIELARKHNLDDVVMFIPAKLNGKSITYRNFDPESPLAGEPVVSVTYNEIGSNRPGYAENVDLMGRGGSGLNAVLFMPASKAKELQESIIRDPELIRQIIEHNAINSLGLKEDKWHTNLRPKYEEWREKNSGQARMAVRAEDGTSQILVF